MTIDEAFVRDLFEKVWPKLDKASTHYGETHTKEQVWELLANRTATLWVHPMDEPTAAMVVYLESYPTGLVDVHGWLAGGDLDGLKEIERQIETWARARGVHRLLTVGREGFIRAMPGYRKVAVIGVKDLRNV